MTRRWGRRPHRRHRSRRRLRQASLAPLGRGRRVRGFVRGVLGQVGGHARQRQRAIVATVGARGLGSSLEPAHRFGRVSFSSEDRGRLERRHDVVRVLLGWGRDLQCLHRRRTFLCCPIGVARPSGALDHSAVAVQPRWPVLRTDSAQSSQNAGNSALSFKFSCNCGLRLPIGMAERRGLPCRHR